MLSATKGSSVLYFRETSDWTMHVMPVSVTTFTLLSASYEVRVLILLVLFNKTWNLSGTTSWCLGSLKREGERGLMEHVTV